MENLIPILTWVSIISGGLLIFLFLFSIVGGLDFETDIDTGSTDLDTDAGGIGLLKGALTFVSVSTWIMKVVLTTDTHPGLALLAAIVSGYVAFYILNGFFKFLIRNEENASWSMEDTLGEKGEVYLRIPAESGNGIVHINVKGALREIKAKAKEEIPTGESIEVIAIEQEYVIVKKQSV